METKVNTRFSALFIKGMNKRGFSISDCPACEIQPEWESFPIIRAIRELEKELDVKYPTL